MASNASMLSDALSRFSKRPDFSPDDVESLETSFTIQWQLEDK